METKAYFEGIVRSWWILVVVAALAFWVGSIIANNQTSKYTASTSILLNGALLDSTAFPSNIVSLGIPRSYQTRVDPPNVLSIIIKSYPRLTVQQLAQNILVNTDKSNQLLLINVTDISPTSSVDIANFLARHFVRVETADLNRQIDTIQGWLQQNILPLNDQINQLSLQIQQLTPPPVLHGAPPPPDPAKVKIIAEDQVKLNFDQRALYNYQLALTEIEQVRPLIDNAYVIMQPATVSPLPTVVPLPTTIIQILAVAIALFVTICLIIVAEFFHPFIRYKTELQRIVGLPVLAQLPKIRRFEQKRLLTLRPLLFSQRIEPVRLLCAVFGALAVKNSGHTMLLTSPRRKRNFAAVLATLLAHSGHQTLLIDANYDKPDIHQQIRPSRPCDLITPEGVPLSFIYKAEQSHLFVLPATARLAQDRRLTSGDLADLLPQLQRTFSVVIIDAPPIDRADTHLLVTKVAQTLIMVKKRRDSIKRLKITRDICEKLNSKPQCLFLT